MNDDFVNVKLTEDAEKHGIVQVHQGKHSFVFKQGTVLRVTKVFDWERILQHERDPQGNGLFELTEERATEDLMQEVRA